MMPSVLRLIVTIASLSSLLMGSAVAAKRGAGAVKAHLAEAYGKLSLSFEANQGQTDPQVKFLSRGGRHVLFLTPTEAVLVLITPKQRAKDEFPRMRGRLGRPEEGTRTVLEMKFVGANPTPMLAGLDELPGKANYFIGNDPTKWRTNVPTYAKVQYQGLYPGIDLLYFGNQGKLEYDLVVRPGADPTRIVLGFEGADRLEVDAGRDLVVHTTAGPIRQRQPVIYQEVDGVREQIQGGYILTAPHQVSFWVAAYDAARPLVIDPTLFYSTYLGGSGGEGGIGIAVDAAGAAYVTGVTTSADFTAGCTAPCTVRDATLGGPLGAPLGGDAFVTKLNATGTALLYSTYLGGSSFEEGIAIAVDDAEAAYVTGVTFSADFAAGCTAPSCTVLDATQGGSRDAFVTKLDPTGTALVYSTYLGGSSTDGGFGLAVDAAGAAYVTGHTSSADFTAGCTAPCTVLDATLGGDDAFVTKLDPMGTALLYSTYLGGSGNIEEGHAIAVDAVGAAYVTGNTTSADYTAGCTAPCTVLDATLDGPLDGDAFVTKIDPTGTALLYSTYLGGSSSENGIGIAVDPAGAAYVVGHTTSADFTAGCTAPCTVLDSTLNGFTDAFVTKLNATGTALLYSTYLGESNREAGDGIAVDATGAAYVTGFTDSADFTAGCTPPCTVLDATLDGTADVFVTKLDPTGTALDYSTYLGGTGSDFGAAIAVDAAGAAYITGITFSADFTAGCTAPCTVLDATLGSSADAFVAKISDVGAPARLTLTPAAATNLVNTQHCVTATVEDTSGNPTPDITVRFSVTGSVTISGTATTDTNGQATFCYTGPQRAGTDSITGHADTDNETVKDPGEPTDRAMKAWVKKKAKKDDDDDEDDDDKNEKKYKKDDEDEDKHKHKHKHKDKNRKK
jgi:hypothetical protein